MPKQSDLETKVFYWEPSDDFQREIRKRAEPDGYDYLWDSRSSKEMRYDALRNEWDFWNNEWYPGKKPRPPMDDDDNDDSGEWWANGDYNTTVPLDYGAPEVNANQNANRDDYEVPENNEKLAPEDFDNLSFEEEIIRSVAPCFALTDGHHNEAIEASKEFPLLASMSLWYGFRPDVEVGKWDQVAIPSRLDLDRTMRLLRDTIVDLDVRTREKIQHFVACLLKENDSPPIKQLDTYGTTMAHFGNKNLRVLRSPYRAREFEDDQSPLYQLYSVEILDERGGVRDDRHGRRLFVWTATAALGVKRLPQRRTKTLDHIAEVLLEHGIGYVSAVDRSRLPIPRWDDRIPSLGRYALKTKTAKTVDFFGYLDKCRNLMSMPRLRKCLRYGGIIWRLALLFLGPRDVIYQPPSPDALNEPLVLEGPDALVDDGVSKDELELLVGTVLVSSGEYRLLGPNMSTDLRS